MLPCFCLLKRMAALLGGNGVAHINEVTPRRARLVPRWVTTQTDSVRASLRLWVGAVSAGEVAMVTADAREELASSALTVGLVVMPVSLVRASSAAWSWSLFSLFMRWTEWTLIMTATQTLSWLILLLLLLQCIIIIYYDCSHTDLIG